VKKHFVIHPTTATVPAMGVCAAQQQGKAHEFEDAVWERGWGGGGMKPMDEKMMLEVATEQKLDLEKFKADLVSEKCKQDLENDRTVLSKVGGRGTPAFWVNGRFMSGNAPVEKFSALIDEEIKKANAAIEGGTKPEDYYRVFIVEKGKKSTQ
jgi:predicted DsbA family dithiol-disulfide isomerase